MRSVLITILLAVIAEGRSQSASFSLLKDNYQNQEDVHTFGLGGFFCRALLSLANDDEFRSAVKDIKSFQLITIPKSVFAAGPHSREGFKRLLKKDNFESLAMTRDHDDNVEIFLQHGSGNDRYLVWTDNNTEVTAIEIEGEIDVNKLIKQSKTLAKQSE